MSLRSSVTPYAIGRSRFLPPLSHNQEFVAPRVEEGYLRIDLGALVSEAEKIAATQADKFRMDTSSNPALAIWRLLTARRYRKGPVAFTQCYEDEAIGRLRRHIEAKIPVRLNISLFPCKVRHPLRTFAELGSEVDVGEMASLLRLYEICAAISSLYPTGAELFVICDGTRYQPCFGDPPSAVADYQNGVRAMVDAMGLAGSLKIIDEAPHLPPTFGQLVGSEMEILASEYRVQTSDIRRNINRLAPTIFLNLDMPPGTSLRTMLCAFLALRDMDPDGDLRHGEIGEELGDRILQSALMFVATNMVLRTYPGRHWRHAIVPKAKWTRAR